MHETIEEINLGLSNLNLVADSQSRTPFDTFQSVYKYLNEVETIEFAFSKNGIAEYEGKYENVMIKIDKKNGDRCFQNIVLTKIIGYIQFLYRTQRY